jgi:hypothetical protein
MTPPFRKQQVGGVSIWRGNPNCQDAHDYLLKRLQVMTGGQFLPPNGALSPRRIGNLGECISFCIGKAEDFANHMPFPANAFEPLSDISRDGIDIVWLLFAENEEHDVCVLQEVKATGGPTPGYADNLLQDYEKLFDEDIKFTLQTRIQAIKNELQYKLQMPELCDRADRLAGKSPSECLGVQLVPTLVHDTTCSNVNDKLLAVRTSISGLGWRLDNIEPWSVQLSNLTDRLARLATGRE